VLAAVAEQTSGPDGEAGVKREQLSVPLQLSREMMRMLGAGVNEQGPRCHFCFRFAGAIADQPSAMR
jgi:hypothetical protein